jgi:hypothetical protein
MIRRVAVDTALGPEGYAIDRAYRRLWRSRSDHSPSRLNFVQADPPNGRTSPGRRRAGPRLLM